MEIPLAVPIAANVRTGVAVLSYGDQITLGLTGDCDIADDLDVPANGIADRFAHLLTAAHAACN